MKDASDLRKAKMDKQHAKWAARLQADAEALTKLREIPMHASWLYQTTTGAYDVTRVPGGWLYSLLDGADKPITTTFVGDPDV